MADWRLSSRWECAGHGRQQPIWEIFYKIVIGHELRYIDETVTGVGIEEGGKFRFSIVNV